MGITNTDVIVWLIVGALAGSVTGFLVKGKKKGFGALLNVGIGLAGALIGGFLFNAFKIDLGLANISVSLEDLISAFVGSLIFLGTLCIVQRQRKKKEKPTESKE